MSASMPTVRLTPRRSPAHRRRAAHKASPARSPHRSHRAKSPARVAAGKRVARSLHRNAKGQFVSKY